MTSGLTACSWRTSSEHVIKAVGGLVQHDVDTQFRRPHVHAADHVPTEVVIHPQQRHGPGALLDRDLDGNVHIARRGYPGR